MKNKKTVKIFNSIEEENEAEYARRAEMTPAERMKEFAIIQERAHGKGWQKKPIEKIATWEMAT